MVLARAEAGARLDAVAEVNGFVRVRFNSAKNSAGNLYGYVAQSGVSPAKGKASVSENGEPKGLSLVYGRDPPNITFLDSSGAAHPRVGERRPQRQLEPRRRLDQRLLLRLQP